MPIDINLLRKEKGGDPEKVKLSQKQRFADETLVD
jgi:seryl-tRNA synthetase